MEFNTKISLETKQVLSQRQVESLNILSMPVADLHNFLQNEEIENPLMEYSLSEPSSKEEVIIRDADSFYSRRQTEKSIDMESILSLVADREFSVEEFVMQQLSAARLTAQEEKIISYAVNCLDENGFLTVRAGEIGADLGIDEETVEGCLSRLKGLEPAGIFASGLAECLRIQVRGMEDEELLGRLIDDHLRDIAEGRLSSITRGPGDPVGARPEADCRDQGVKSPAAQRIFRRGHRVHHPGCHLPSERRAVGGGAGGPVREPRGSQ